MAARIDIDKEKEAHRDKEKEFLNSECIRMCEKMMKQYPNTWKSKLKKMPKYEAFKELLIEMR